MIAVLLSVTLSRKLSPPVHKDTLPIRTCMLRGLVVFQLWLMETLHKKHENRGDGIFDMIARVKNDLFAAPPAHNIVSHESTQVANFCESQ